MSLSTACLKTSPLYGSTHVPTSLAPVENQTWNLTITPFVTTKIMIQIFMFGFVGFQVKSNRSLCFANSTHCKVKQPFYHLPPLFWNFCWPPLQVILLMEEILHHLGCIKPCKEQDIYHINGERRISSINRISSSLLATWNWQLLAKSFAKHYRGRKNTHFPSPTFWVDLFFKGRSYPSTLQQLNKLKNIQAALSEKNNKLINSKMFSTIIQTGSLNNILFTNMMAKCKSHRIHVWNIYLHLL